MTIVPSDVQSYDLPFDSALLFATTATHALRDHPPEDFVIYIFSLLHSQFGHDTSQFLLLFLRPSP